MFNESTDMQLDVFPVIIATILHADEKVTVPTMQTQACDRFIHRLQSQDKVPAFIR